MQTVATWMTWTVKTQRGASRPEQTCTAAPATVAELGGDVAAVHIVGSGVVAVESIVQDASCAMAESTQFEMLETAEW